MEFIDIYSDNLNLQIWQKQNLDVTCFNNGDNILEVKTKREKADAISKRLPAWCIDPEDPNQSEKLYNIYAINDSRGILPSGLRLPEKSDFIILISHFKKVQENTKKFKNSLKNDLSIWWSCTKFSNKDYYSLVFSHDENYSKIITSDIADYCSVRCIMTSNKYLLGNESKSSSDLISKIQIKIEKGDSLFIDGNVDEAISIYEEIIPMCVNNAHLYFKLGKAYLANNNIIKATDYFEKTILLDPNYSDAYYFLGLSKVNNIMFGVTYAEPYFDKAIKLNPSNFEYYRVRAVEREKIRNYEGYIDDIEKANLEVIPGNYYEYRALIKSRSGDNLGAISDYDILISRNSSFGRYYYYRGQLKVKLDVKSAINDFNYSVELNSEYLNDVNFLVDYGIVLYKSGNLEKALESFNTSIECQIKEGYFISVCYYYRSKCFFDIGFFEEALLDIQKILNDYEPKYLLHHIEILLKLSRFDESFIALNNYKKYSIDRIYFNEYLDLYYFLFGEYYFNIQNRKLAYEYFLKSGDLGYSLAYEQIVKFKLVDVSIINPLVSSPNVESKELFHDNISMVINNRFPMYKLRRDQYFLTYRALLTDNEFQKVINKVHSSESFKKFIDSCKEKKLLPQQDDFLKAVCISKAFMFVINYNKIDVACIELFDIWVKEINMKYNIVHDESLIYFLEGILKKSYDLAQGK
jgi:tetratricopeptide (TPR) repeat protein